MTPPIRVAVNARVLEAGGGPFARLTSAEIVRMLSDDPGFSLDLAASEPIPRLSELTARQHRLPSPRGAYGDAWFDQVRFPRFARQLEADMLLYLHPSAPIVSPAPTAAWFGDGPSSPSTGRLAERIDRSLAGAGMRGAAAVLHTLDLPPGSTDFRWTGVPPIVPLGFFDGEGTKSAGRSARFPDSFVLVAAEPGSEVPLLLAAWTWVESSLGDTHRLLFACVDEVARRQVEQAAHRLGLEETVLSEVLSDEAWPEACHTAAALLASGGRGNAAVLRWAMASGLPVAALVTPVTESILGPAAYLIAQPNPRALGAACLTLLVEDQVADSLRQKGMLRAKAYHPGVAAPAWADALRAAAKRHPRARA